VIVIGIFEIHRKRKEKEADERFQQEEERQKIM
jgi:hypothetical protein